MIIQCTECSRTLKVADEHAGRRARCPSCQAIVTVPAVEDSRAKAARATEPTMAQAPGVPQGTSAYSAAAKSETPLPQQTPLPMSRPGNPPAPKSSTALVPAPPTYSGSNHHGGNGQAGNSHYPPNSNYGAQNANYGAQNARAHQPSYSHYPQQQTHYHPRRPQQSNSDPGIAALLEVLGGMFAQTFGIGHIYAGNIAAGLLFMFGYWFLCFINIILMMFLIGFLTYPLCWVLFMVLSPIVAANTVKRY